MQYNGVHIFKDQDHHIRAKQILPEMKYTKTLYSSVGFNHYIQKWDTSSNASHKLHFSDEISNSTWTCIEYTVMYLVSLWHTDDNIRTIYTSFKSGLKATLVRAYSVIGKLYTQ